jgi:hypothetical protein
LRPDHQAQFVGCKHTVTISQERFEQFHLDGTRGNAVAVAEQTATSRIKKKRPKANSRNSFAARHRGQILDR